MTGIAAVVLVSHGSPEPESNAQFLTLRDAVRARRPGWRVEAGFLERAHPSFADVLGGLVADGAGSIAVVPCFLFPGGHADDDIPAVIAEALRQAQGRGDAAASRRPGVEIRLGGTLSEQEVIADILLDQVPLEAMNSGNATIVLVAAGSVATRNREAIERLVKTVRGRTGLSTRFGYLDHGEPLIGAVLAAAAAERPGWLIVMPCLLFAGQYMRSLRRMVEGVRAASKASMFKTGEPFGLDPRMPAVVEALAARLLGNAI